MQITVGILPQFIRPKLMYLSGSSVKILCALTYYMYGKTGGGFPSRETLMRDSGVGCTKTFAAAIEDLRSAGILQISRRRRQTQVYYLRDEKNG
jgi:hypothetical protein